MRPFPTRAAYAFFVASTIALAACNDGANLTQVTPRDANARVLADTLLGSTCILPKSIGDDVHAATTCGTGGTGGGGTGGGGGSPPPPPPGPLVNWIDFVPLQLDLLSTQTSLEVMVSTFQSPVTDAWVNVDIVSSAGTLNVYRVPVSCPNEPQGTLYGNCVFWLWPSAPASTPPSFPAGAATLHVTLVHSSGSLISGNDQQHGITLVDSRAKVSNLLPVRMGPVIDATAADNYTMTVNNPLTTPRSIAYFRYYVKQNSVIHYSNAALFGCGSLLVSGGTGQLPSGSSCTSTAAFNVSNTNQPGTLVSGAGTFGVQIINVATGQIESESTYPLILNAHPTINPLTLSGAAFVGVSPLTQAVILAADTSVIQYTGSVSFDAVKVRDTIIQNGVSHSAGSHDLNCGGGQGILPGNLPGGICKFTSTFAASDPALVPGQATLKKVIFDPANGILTTQTVPLTLGALPTLGDPILNSTALVIDGPPVGYTAPASNSGPTLPNAMTLKAILTQSGGVLRIVDSRPVNCGPSGTGGMLSGDCSIAGLLTVSSVGGTGTLIAGQPASIEFQIIDNASGAVLARTFTSVSLQ